MNTQTIDTEKIKEGVNLGDLAGHYTILRRESTGEVAGPCPKCGGDDRFHCHADWFFCRQCHEKRGDAIEFLQWLNGLSFLEACAALSDGSLPMATGSPATPKRAKIERKTLSHTKAQSIAKIASVALLDSSEGQPGRDYLTGRGLFPEMWELFGLGFCLASLPGTWNSEIKQRTMQKQPAICLPWILGNGKIPAIRYRFLSVQTYTDIDGQERSEKQTAQFASEFIGHLFGGCALSGPDNVPALVLCEGELNAMSVWQSTAGAVDVLSMGGKDTHLTEAAIRDILKYKRVIVWMDRTETAKNYMAALPGALGYRSPFPDNTGDYGMDANDCLLTRKLHELLQQLIER